MTGQHKGEEGPRHLEFHKFKWLWIYKVWGLAANRIRRAKVVILSTPCIEDTIMRMRHLILVWEHFFVHHIAFVLMSLFVLIWFNQIWQKGFLDTDSMVWPCPTVRLLDTPTRRQPTHIGKDQSPCWLTRLKKTWHRTTKNTTKTKKQKHSVPAGGDNL